jgi:DNA-binding NtrC family response regulator
MNMSPMRSFFVWCGHPQARSLDAVSARGARRVVIADDEEEIRDLLAEYLQTHGWETFRAANGLEALLHVKQQRPAAVVLDLNMPRLGGIDALKRIRTFDPTIAVVVVSANADDNMRMQAEALGVKAILDKPLDLVQLLAALGGDAPAAAPRAAAVEAPVASEAAGPPARRRSVLVVDDDPDVRGVLEEFLALKGYHVRVSPDGAAAVRELAGPAPGVVLLDIEMPGLSGVDALPTIKAMAPATAVIMVSGTVNVELARRALAAGAFDYVMKPVDLPRLLESIETAFAMLALDV